MVYKLLAAVLFPMFVAHRLLMSSSIIWKTLPYFYSLLGAKVGQGVIIKARVSLLGVKNISLGKSVYIGENTKLVAYDSPISIGDNSLVAANCLLISRSHQYSGSATINRQGYTNSPVTVGSDVWIGDGAVIVAGVTIGDGAIVGARSVVTRDVMPNTIVGGVPARFIKDRYH